MAILDKLNKLGLRVYNNAMEVKTNEKGETIYNDEEDILSLINKTFNSGSPSQEMLHTFNEVVVRTAEIIAEPRLEQIINLFASYDTVADGTIKMVKLPKTREKAHLVWSATATTVDYVRLSKDETHKIAVPYSMSTGAYYELADFSTNGVEAFRNVVDTVADAIVQLYFDKVTEIIASASESGDIPAANCASGSNLTLAEYRKAEQVMIRLGGGAPTFVADSVLIDHLAMQQANVVTSADNLLTDDLRKSLREDLQITKVSKSTAVNLVNPFTTDEHDEVAFAVNEGYLFPAGSNAKPIEITKYGQAKQFSSFDTEEEIVRLKIKLKLSVDLIDAKKIGLVKDDALALA